jgi:hypothetical protein
MSSAFDNLGPHLLGRIPSKPDARNYPLELFLSADPIDQALSTLLADKHVAAGTKQWATFASSYLKLISPPTPPAPTPPPAGAKLWSDAEAVLDQGQTSHCVGFGGAQWGNTDPVDDKYTNADGDKIYYECKVIDGEPNQEDGSTVHSLATCLQNRGRLNVYAWASTTDAITQFLSTQGSVIVGTDWYNDMFNPDANGFIAPTGGVAGGHCFLLDEYDPTQEAYGILNSWSSSWGKNGRAYIKIADFNTLLQSNGEALAAVELPLS